LFLLGLALQALVIASIGRALARTHGVEGAARIVVAGLLPVVLYIYIGGLLTTGFTRAPAFVQFMRVKMMFWAFVFPWSILPRVFEWSGDFGTAQRVFVGAALGLVVAFLAQLHAAKTHRSWLLRKGPDGWRWRYRAMSSLATAIGGYVALQLG